jgi:lysophospholipase L1-like esterase
MLSAFRWLGQLWIAFGVALVLLILIDQCLRALIPEPTRVPFDPAARAPAREQASAVQDAPWIGDYWTEHEASRHTRWRSYVYWRRQPFSGRIINIDAHGFRITPGMAKAEKQLWLFGGSTVWGTGNRDQGTLAAALQSLLNARGHSLDVLNFGESGYVSHQSLQAFQLALRCGARPSIALFLDGANDVYAAYQRGGAGTPQNEATRELEFLSSQRPRRLLAAIAARFQGLTRLVAAAPEPREAEALRALAGAVVDHYLASADQARALAQAAGIVTIHRWQPTVFDRQPQGDEPAIIGASDREHAALQREATAAIQRRAPELAIELATPEPLYVDFVHLSERGQLRLAEALADQIERSLPTAPAAKRAACENLPVAISDQP